jgi:hypothetical protein
VFACRLAVEKSCSLSVSILFMLRLDASARQRRRLGARARLQYAACRRGLSDPLSKGTFPLRT